MGYYGRSIYRGDFYRGARGDFLDDLGGVLGDIGGTIGNVLSFVPGVSKVLNASNQSYNRTMTPHPALQSPGVGGGGLTPLPSMGPNVVIPGVGAGRVKLGKGKSGSRPIDIMANGGGHRRMNACNPKALRRALRRTGAFMHFAKKYVKLVHPKVHVEMRARPLKHHKK